MPSVTVADQSRGYFHTVHLGEKALNLAHRHPARVQAPESCRRSR
jgi:hypothetical protein